MPKSKDVLCNLCGLSCDIPGCIPKEIRQPSGLIDATVSGGYDSTPGNGFGALDDCTQYKFSLCEWCLDWLFQQFKISPEEKEIGVFSGDYDGTIEQWKPAAQRVKEDDWRAGKEEFRIEYERRNQARSNK